MFSCYRWDYVWYFIDGMVVEFYFLSIELLSAWMARFTAFFARNFEREMDFSSMVAWLTIHASMLSRAFETYFDMWSCSQPNWSTKPALYFHTSSKTLSSVNAIKIEILSRPDAFSYLCFMLKNQLMQFHVLNYQCSMKWVLQFELLSHAEQFNFSQLYRDEVINSKLCRDEKCMPRICHCDNI